MANMPYVEIMSRRECDLCASAPRVVEQAANQGMCTWGSVDVDRDKALLVRYGMDVPVILVNGEEQFRHRVDARALNTLLEAYTC